MTTVGSFRDAFSRRYLYLNPDPFLGPGAWRLTNIPGVDDDNVPNEIENLYAVPPIFNDQIGQVANLRFDIEGAPDINSPRSPVSLSDSINSLLNQGDLLPMMGGTLFDLEKIKGVAPVMTRQSGDDSYIWLNIDSLPNIDAARDARKIGVTLGSFGYNSRSVTSITAAQPLKAVTTADIATVSFDITTLPDA